MRERLRQEAESFLGAVRFFTRLPVPAWVGHSTEGLNQSARYFPLVGALVGALGAAAYVLSSLVFPLGLSVLISMVVTVLITGAFHEDGFADAVDGFGGGWEKAQILTIMKDSRIGSYGALGLVLILMIKFQALLALSATVIVVALIAAHAISRGCAVALIFALDYVREDETARAKPLANKMDAQGLALAAGFALMPALFLPWKAALAGVVLAAITTSLAARYFKRRIGGYTGDCLGATQQVTEVAFYLGLVGVLWNSY